VAAEENKESGGVRSLMPMFNFFTDIHEFCWDPENSSKEITFSTDYRHAFLAE